MRTIYKFPLAEHSDDKGIVHLEIPHKAKILRVDLQNGKSCIWVEFRKDDDKITRKFKVFGTGWDIPYGFDHVATWFEDPFVWHLYEVKQ